MSRLHADLALLLAAAVWGLAFLFQKSAMDHIGPLLFIAARGATAALALAPLAIYERRRSPGPAARGFWATTAWGGAAFFVAAWLQQAGLKTATVTNTSFLTALYVVITPFIVWGSRRIRPGLLVWTAAALSALGTWLLGGGTIGGFSSGDLMVAASAFFWAGHVVITASASRFARPIGYTALQFAVVGGLAGLGTALLEDISFEGLRGAALDILYVGLLSSALTFTLLTIALQYTPPAEAAVIVSLETVFAALGAYMVLGEQLSTIGWLGASLILISVLLIQSGTALSSPGRREPVAEP